MSDSPSDTPSKESSINSVPEPQEEVHPPATMPVPTPGIPEEPVVAWTDQQTEASIAKMRPLLAKLDKSVLRAKDITLEVLRELFRAKRALTSPGARNDLSSGQTPRGWAPYCERLGRSVRTFDRWLEQFDPKGDCLKPKVLSLDAVGQGETTDTVYGSNKRKLSQPETDVVKALTRLGYGKVVARDLVLQASESLPDSHDEQELVTRALAIAGGEKFFIEPHPVSGFDKVIEAMQALGSLDKIADALDIFPYKLNELIGIKPRFDPAEVVKDKPPKTVGVEAWTTPITIPTAEERAQPIAVIPEGQEDQVEEQDQDALKVESWQEVDELEQEEEKEAKQEAAEKSGEAWAAQECSAIPQTEQDSGPEDGVIEDDEEEGEDQTEEEEKRVEAEVIAEQEAFEEQDRQDEIKEGRYEQDEWDQFPYAISLLKDTGITQTRDALQRIAVNHLWKFAVHYPHDADGSLKLPPKKFAYDLRRALSMIHRRIKEIDDAYIDLAVLIRDVLGEETNYDTFEDVPVEFTEKNGQEE